MLTIHDRNNAIEPPIKIDISKKLPEIKSIILEYFYIALDQKPEYRKIVSRHFAQKLFNFLRGHYDLKSLKARNDNLEEYYNQLVVFLESNLTEDNYTRVNLYVTSDAMNRYELNDQHFFTQLQSEISKMHCNSGAKREITEAMTSAFETKRTMLTKHITTLQNSDMKFSAIAFIIGTGAAKLAEGFMYEAVELKFKLMDMSRKRELTPADEEMRNSMLEKFNTDLVLIVTLLAIPIGLVIYYGQALIRHKPTFVVDEFLKKHGFYNGYQNLVAGFDDINLSLTRVKTKSNDYQFQMYQSQPKIDETKTIESNDGHTNLSEVKTSIGNVEDTIANDKGKEVKKESSITRMPFSWFRSPQYDPTANDDRALEIKTNWVLANNSSIQLNDEWMIPYEATNSSRDFIKNKVFLYLKADEIPRELNEQYFDSVVADQRNVFNLSHGVWSIKSSENYRFVGIEMGEPSKNNGMLLVYFFKFMNHEEYEKEIHRMQQFANDLRRDATLQLSKLSTPVVTPISSTTSTSPATLNPDASRSKRRK